MEKKLDAKEARVQIWEELLRVVQVVDVDVTVEDYDTAIDYIVTPTRLIETRHEYPRPSKGIIWSRLAPGMREQIPPIQELWCKVHCK